MNNSEKTKLVFATNNQHKFEEIKQVLDDKVNLLSLADIGFSDEIPEEQDTLEDNAAQKAFFIYHKYGMDCFSDDTGLEIEALQGEPGVYSARYAGEKCSFDDNMNLVLLKMIGKNNRKARFRTVIALVEQGRLYTFEGKICGLIALERLGMKGFGYDPIFIPDGYKCTFAEMSLTEKNRISHRAIAVNSFISHIVAKSNNSAGINKV
jgi:XTP/dITP diphosphohydrolase